MRSALFSLLFMVSAMFARAQTSVDSSVVYSTDSVANEMLTYSVKFIGADYGNRGKDTTSFDCSGFVRHVYGKYGVSLPGGSSNQATLCEKIDLKEVQPGDLLFFSGSKVSKKKIGHVSLVLSVEGDEIVMIHATVHNGVMKETLSKSAYFTKRFIKAGRLKNGLLPLK